MSKFVKSRPLVDDIDGKKVLKSITDFLLIIVTDIKNCKPIKMIDVATKAKTCFPGSPGISREKKEFHQSCLKCYQVFCVNKHCWSLIPCSVIFYLNKSLIFWLFCTPLQVLSIWCVRLHVHTLVHAPLVWCVKKTTRHFCLWHLLFGTLELRKWKHQTSNWIIDYFSLVFANLSLKVH